MSTPQDTPVQQAQEKANDKEYNFRMLEAKYQRQLEQERQARLEAERIAQERLSQVSKSDDEEDDDDPYIDKKKFKKTLSNFGQNTQSEIQKAMEYAKKQAKEELKQELWLEQNPDFYDTLQLAEKLALQAPKLAETILKMPDNFERQKLVYQNIKALGIDKPPAPQSSVQDQINEKRKGYYYSPSSTATPAYNSNHGDFSPQGQKQAYEKLQQLKANLRLG